MKVAENSEINKKKQPTICMAMSDLCFYRSFICSSYMEYSSALRIDMSFGNGSVNIC